MYESRLTDETKRCAVIGSLAEEHFDLEIATFLKVARSSIFNERTEHKDAKFYKATVSWRKHHFSAILIHQDTGIS